MKFFRNKPKTNIQKYIKKFKAIVLRFKQGIGSSTGTAKAQCRSHIGGKYCCTQEKEQMKNTLRHC